MIGRGQKQVLALGGGERIYCALPLYHSNGALIAFGGALVAGAGLILARKFHASSFWEDCHRHGATRMIYIGELLRYLVNTPPGPYDTQHKVTQILGNGLRGDVWPAFQERFGVPHIREFYAATEGNAATITLENIPGSVGKPTQNRPDNLALVSWDEEKGQHRRGKEGNLVECRPGEVGELLGRITRLTPFPGYADPKETERKLFRNAFRPGDCYYRTGDLMRKDNAGHYYFVDRIGDTFRWKGENVSTEEVQKILCGFGAIAIANVYGVAVPGAEGRAGMAAPWLRDGAPLELPALYAYVKQHLPPYARPAFVRVLSEMTVTATFKIVKPALKKTGLRPGENSRTPLFPRRRRRRLPPAGKKLPQGNSRRNNPLLTGPAAEQQPQPPAAHFKKREQTF